MKRMKKLLALVLVLTMLIAAGVTGMSAAVSAADEKSLVVYFANWNIYNEPYSGNAKNLPWDRISYLNHAFWEIIPSGGGYEIVSTDPQADYAESNENAHFKVYEEYHELFPEVKIMLSIGGWTKCGFFSEMASTQAGRDSFVESCIETMNQYPWIAGIDVDWEYPGVQRAGGPGDQGNPVVGDDFNNYTYLLRDMRAAFDAEYGAGVKKITTCSSVGVSTIQQQDIRQFSQYVDLINIMSYDMTGSYDPRTGHQAALKTVGSAHSVERAIAYFNQQGVPNSKINIGTPLYCHGWGNVDVTQPNLVGVPGSGSGYIGDKVWRILKGYELAAKSSNSELGWHVGYDTNAEAAYLWNNDPSNSAYRNFLTYENERSLQAKIDYINDLGLAGIIVWETGGDSANDNYPMLTQMSRGLGIWDGEQSTFGQGGGVVLPGIDPPDPIGYPDPITETVAGTGETTYSVGDYIYYKGALWVCKNGNANDDPVNLPDGQWGASCWDKEFDVKTYVGQEELGYWAWLTDGDEYFFYDPNKDGIGEIHYATQQVSNTANDAPDGQWGDASWDYVTTLVLASTSLPDPMTELVAGYGDNTFPKGSYIYYNDAIWKALKETDDYVENLPGGQWGASEWEKVFDVNTYVSQEELGYWSWLTDGDEYFFYDPDKDGTGGLYYATQQVSNTADDAPDGQWGASSWEYVTTLITTDGPVIGEYIPKYESGAALTTLVSDPLYFGEWQSRPFELNGDIIDTYPEGAVVLYDGKYYENYAPSSVWDNGWEPDVHNNWHEITIIPEEDPVAAALLIKIGSDETYNTYFNSVEESEYPSIIKNGKAFVPFRYGSRILGGEVEWVEQGQQLIVSYDFFNYEVRFAIGSNIGEVWIGGEYRSEYNITIGENEVPFLDEAGKAFLPARVLADTTRIGTDMYIAYKYVEGTDYIIYSFSELDTAEIDAIIAKGGSKI